VLVEPLLAFAAGLVLDVETPEIRPCQPGGWTDDHGETGRSLPLERLELSVRRGSLDERLPAHRRPVRTAQRLAVLVQDDADRPLAGDWDGDESEACVSVDELSQTFPYTLHSTTSPRLGGEPGERERSPGLLAQKLSRSCGIDERSQYFRGKATCVPAPWSMTVP
jgi:hypothetical protein